MDFQLNEDQAALMSAVQDMLADHATLPQSERLQYHYFDVGLQQKLFDAGFLDTARTMGPLEAALVIEAAARLPAVVEVGASALVVPHLFMHEALAGPVALVSGATLDKPHRNLSIARTALVDLGEDVAVLSLSPGEVIPVETILGYPFGRFARPPALAGARHLSGAGAAMRQWWRVALAAEFAGAAQAAIAFTVDYVKERHAFGHPIGAFQAVQHRLVQCHQVAIGLRYLTLRAAWSGEPLHADMAACFAQQQVRRILFDLHQFNGAMGVTNEHLLHFWTYRLRALQSEAGGVYDSAVSVAQRLWCDDAAGEVTCFNAQKDR